MSRRLTKAELEAKGALEQAAKEISWNDYEVASKDIALLLEKVHYGNEINAVARELVVYIQEFGREFL